MLDSLFSFLISDPLLVQIKSLHLWFATIDQKLYVPFLTSIDIFCQTNWNMKQKTVDSIGLSLWSCNKVVGVFLSQNYCIWVSDNCSLLSYSWLFTASLLPQKQVHSKDIFYNLLSFVNLVLCLHLFLAGKQYTGRLCCYLSTWEVKT